MHKIETGEDTKYMDSKIFKNQHDTEMRDSRSMIIMSPFENHESVVTMKEITYDGPQ